MRPDRTARDTAVFQRSSFRGDLGDRDAGRSPSRSRSTHDGRPSGPSFMRRLHTLMHRSVRGAFLGLAALGMVATACSSSSSKSGSSSGSGASGATTTIAAKQGGDLVFSAEQEPDCVDWIGSCAGAAWGTYTIGANTMPRAYDFTDQSVFAPSPVLTARLMSWRTQGASPGISASIRRSRRALSLWKSEIGC